MTAVAIFYDHWKHVRAAPASFRKPAALWKKVVWYKANPRTLDYMRTLLNERYPTMPFIEKFEDIHSLNEAPSKVVLLYPDSIGLGFWTIERKLSRLTSVNEIEVLNGRKRQFPFDARTQFALRLRRVIEWTMVVELFTGAAILITTPFLLLADFVRGKS